MRFASGTVDVIERESQSIVVANKTVATRSQVNKWSCYKF